MISTSGLHMDQAPPLWIPFRFFATAPLFMALFGLALIRWREVLFVTPLMPESVATVHLLLLGWLAMVMFGAMYQMIPVLAGLPVPWVKSAWLVHPLLAVGGVLFFLEIGAGTEWGLLPLTGGVLGGAVLLFLGPVGVALARAPAKHPTVWGMRLALICLAAVLGLGLFFVWEYAVGFTALDRYALVGAHLVLGLLGWVGALIVGVSFQVLPMFYMMPPFPPLQGARILTGLALSLLLLPLALLMGLPGEALWLAALPGVAGLGMYARSMRTAYAQRKRKRTDVTFHFWIFGFGCGAVALGLMALWPVWEEERLRFLFGIFYILGWAGSVILGMLYKIIPFLVWFHRFSRLAGLAQIPMMDDLVPERVMKAHLPLHAVVVATLAGAAWSGWGALSVLAGAGMILSAGFLAYVLWFALRQKPPEMPAMPDFSAFFKDMGGMSGPGSS